MTILSYSVPLTVAALLVSAQGCTTRGAPGPDDPTRADSVSPPPAEPSAVEQALGPYLAIRRRTIPSSERPGDQVRSHEISVEGCTIRERIVNAVGSRGYVRDRTDRTDLTMLDTTTMRVDPHVREPAFHDIYVAGVSGGVVNRWEAEFRDLATGAVLDGPTYPRSENASYWVIWFPSRALADSAVVALRGAAALRRPQ